MRANLFEPQVDENPQGEERTRRMVKRGVPANDELSAETRKGCVR